MRIQELERKTGLERPTIRFYEKEGLLQPDRSENGYRDYTEEHVQQLLRIKLLRQLGMSVDRIGYIQKGSADFTSELDQQVKILTARIAENTRAKAVCETMRNDRVEYSTLDAEHYLALLRDASYGTSAYRTQFHEDVPKPIHPWRRYFARTLDYALWGAIIRFVLFVLIRIRPIPGEFLSALLTMAVCAAFIPLEAMMLHFWGTTPGKLAMGIRIEYIQGGNLPMDRALERAVSVWKSGVAFGIPLVELVVMRIRYCRLTGRAIWRGQRYDDISPPTDMDWDYESELIYTDWEGKRLAALGCMAALLLGLSAITALDSVKPKYRGPEITVEEFSQNYNATVGVLETDNASFDRMQPDGSWVPDPPATVIVHIGGKPAYDQVPLRFDTEEGILRSITYENSWTEVFYLEPINRVCQNIAITALLSQDGIGIAELERFSKEMDLMKSEEQGTVTCGNVDVSWQITYEGCRYVGGILSGDVDVDNQGFMTEADGTASIVFNVMIRNEE